MAQMRNAAGFAALLKELNACPEAYKWAHGKTFHRVWQTCDRADWLLWSAGKMVGQPGWPTSARSWCWQLVPVLKPLSNM